MSPKKRIKQVTSWPGWPIVERAIGWIGPAGVIAIVVWVWTQALERHDALRELHNNTTDVSSLIKQVDDLRTNKLDKRLFWDRAMGRGTPTTQP